MCLLTPLPGKYLRYFLWQRRSRKRAALRTDFIGSELRLPPAAAGAYFCPADKSMPPIC